VEKKRTAVGQSDGVAVWPALAAHNATAATTSRLTTSRWRGNGGEKKALCRGRLRDQYTLGAAAGRALHAPTTTTTTTGVTASRSSTAVTTVPGNVTDVTSVPHLQRHRHRVGRLMFSFSIPVCRRPCPTTKYSAYADPFSPPYLVRTMHAHYRFVSV